jgi:hypothetical protein
MRPALAPPRTLTALLLASLSAASQAQTVYRCGNTYSQTPCPDARVVDATDTRTAAQRAEARRVAQAERELAAELRRDRLSEEARARPTAATSLGGPPPASAPSSAAKRAGPKKKKKVERSPGLSDPIVIDPGSRSAGKPR